jgi:hypothetical protein
MIPTPFPPTLHPRQQSSAAARICELHANVPRDEGRYAALRIVFESLANDSLAAVLIEAHPGRRHRGPLDLLYTALFKLTVSVYGGAGGRYSESQLW